MTPETKMSGETSDMTTFCEFGWYQWVYFRDTSMTFPGEKLVLGRCCGPSIDVGPALTADILRTNGQQFHRSTYGALKPDELVNLDGIKALDEFDMATEENLGPATSAKYSESDLEIVTPSLDRYEDDEEHQTHMPEVDDITPEVIENYIGAEIMIYHGDTVAQGSVKRRKRNVEVNTIGKANSNPIIDTKTYEVEFEDGSMSTYSEDVIAESMYAQCDEEGQQYLLFGSILDHNTDGHALLVADKYVVLCGRSSKRKTTKGWHLFVQLKDGTTT